MVTSVPPLIGVTGSSYHSSPLIDASKWTLPLTPEGGADGDADGLALPLGLALADGLRLVDADGLRLADADGLALPDGDALALPDGDALALSAAE